MIELVTDDNICGISEIPGTLSIDMALEKSKSLIIGKDPFQLNLIKDTLVANFGVDKISDRGDAPWDQRTLVHLFSAIEVACLDIIGKIINRPVVDILGGRRRDAVPFSAYLFYKYAGAGGKLGFGTDPNATGWSAARQASALDPTEIVTQAKTPAFNFID